MLKFCLNKDHFPQTSIDPFLPRDLRKKLSSASRTTKLNKDWGNKFWGINSPEDALTQGGSLDLRSLDLPLEVLYTEIVPKVQPASISCASL